MSELCLFFFCVRLRLRDFSMRDVAIRPFGLKPLTVSVLRGSMSWNSSSSNLLIDPTSVSPDSTLVLYLFAKFVAFAFGELMEAIRSKLLA